MTSWWRQHRLALTALLCAVIPLAVAFDACFAARAHSFPVFYIIVPALIYFTAGALFADVAASVQAERRATYEKYLRRAVDNNRDRC